MERRLAAILAADVVGCSRLMGDDEVGTLQRLTDVRKTPIEPLVGRHRGHVVKLMGDGLLVEFKSVVDAVECAVAWQLALAEREGDTPENQRFRFRIAVNIGDVLIDGDDIFGDGVNVAARLEALAEAARQAIQLDPADGAANAVYGFTRIFRWEFDEGLIHLRRAATLALLGRLDEARVELEKLNERLPNATIAQVERAVPIQDPDAHGRWLNALRTAGMPER